VTIAFADLAAAALAARSCGVPFFDRRRPARQDTARCCSWEFYDLAVLLPGRWFFTNKPGGEPRRFMVDWKSVIVSPPRAVGGKSRPSVRAVGRGALMLACEAPAVNPMNQAKLLMK
jgi:hypothetical protein